MRSRRFWRRHGLIAEALVPFSVLWYGWMRIREDRANPKKLSVPVICVGNAVAGGAGKTPVAMALAELMVTLGHKPAFISRGYGGKQKTPMKVEPEKHFSPQVGDEPLLLARIAPCYVARQRVEAAELAISQGATVLIADDGMFNHSFVKDYTFCVVDGGYGFGNRMVLPAGPLRDRIDHALKRADAALIIGDAQPKTVELINQANLPIHYALLTPDILPDTGKAHVAFAGIGIPDKFFDMLTRLGVNAVEKVAFPDHHPYRRKDIHKLRRLARKHNATLLTTTKDAVRLPPLFRQEVTTLPVTLKFRDAQSIVSVLHKVIK